MDKNIIGMPGFFLSGPALLFEEICLKDGQEKFLEKNNGPLV